MHRYSLGSQPVHRIGFGAMQLPGPGVFGPPRDHDAAIAVLRRAVELGVDHIDTSQYYGPDVANALIREALHPYPDELVLVTKVGGRRDDVGAWLPAQRPDELRQGVEDNLRTLGIERIGAVNLRLIGEPELPPEQRVAYEDQLAEMAALRDEGKLAGIGISTASLAEVEQAIDAVGIVCVQNAFSLLDQHDADVLDRCAAEGIAYVPVLPARLRVPRHAQGHRGRSGAQRRRPARRHPRADRAGLAARPPRQHPPHPRHVERRPPRGEHGHG